MAEPQPPGTMRLLSRGADGKIVLTSFQGDKLPRYAIVSHTWGEQELLFNDLVQDQERSEIRSLDRRALNNVYDEITPGHHGLKTTRLNKVQFFLDQAATDGLDYVWIDTLCVNRMRFAELFEAVNSMFLWYHNACRCYVYLSDVPAWNFRLSRWFTRAWTLPEMLAPRDLEFYDCMGQSVGTKASLINEIHQITRIPVAALQGAPLVQFSVTERLSWGAPRSATIPEDSAYSMLGIFGVYMPLLYGEGRDHARQRLLDEIHGTGLKRRRGVPVSREHEPQVDMTENGVATSATRESVTNTSSTFLAAQRAVNHQEENLLAASSRTGLGLGYRGLQISLELLGQTYCRFYQMLLSSVVIVSLAVSICYSTIKDDAGGGFTIGAFLLAGGGLLTNEMRARHRKYCKCDDAG